jgi:hypothetical protein
MLVVELSSSLIEGVVDQIVVRFGKSVVSLVRFQMSVCSAPLRELNGWLLWDGEDRLGEQWEAFLRWTFWTKPFVEYCAIFLFRRPDLDLSQKAPQGIVKWRSIRNVIVDALNRLQRNQHH